MTDDKIAARIGAALALAQNASTEGERDAAMNKAQQLSTRYQVDLELARIAHTMRQAAPVPTSRRIIMGERGQRGLYTYVELFHRIADPNNVKITVASNSTYVTAYGFDSDIDSVEQLYHSLVLQMVAASRAYIATGEHRKVRVQTAYDWVGKPQSTLTARLSFQQAFAIRVGQRLDEAKEQALLEMDREARDEGLSTGAELVLSGREVAVRDFYDRTNNAGRRSYRGGQGATHARPTWDAGKAAGDKARLAPSRPIGGARAAVSA